MVQAAILTRGVIDILRCPLTGQPLRLGGENHRALIESKIASGTIKYADGSPVDELPTQILVAQDDSCAYAVKDGLLELLAERALLLSAHACPMDDDLRMSGVTAGVRAFYDDVGWLKTSEDEFNDAALFEDSRPLCAEYIRERHLSLKRHIKANGDFLVDVASGPLQRPEFIQYSDGYAKRICIDVSRRALLEARQKLGDKGLYIMGDICNLPLADSACDALVSVHTLFHVPAERQERAVREMHRVLKRGCTAAVVYCWGYEPLMRRLRNLLPLHRNGGDPAETISSCDKKWLYFQPHNYDWFRRRNWGFKIDFAVWRTLPEHRLKQWIHEKLFGRQILEFVGLVEDCFPRLLALLSNRPILIIHKD